MIHNLKPYPVYKDSGVPWLGQVPEHWKTARCGSLFREIVDTGHPELELLSIDRFKGIIRQSETGRKERASEDRSLYKRVRPGELAYNLMNAFMGSIGFSKLDGIISPAYAVGRPLQEINTAYFHYLFRTQLFTGQFDCYSYGIMYERNRLYFDRFKQIYTYIPPLAEQSAIVRYLDYMDRRIRRYIHAKQKLIKLLEEQKQAIIHRAVTRGLDPNVKLKPSGVEWPRDVPEGWEIKRIKHLALLKSGESITSLEINEKGYYPVFGGNGLRGFTSNYTHNGDFVLIGRQGALCGNVNYASGCFWASEHAVVANPIQVYNLLWFGELLRTMNLNQYSISAAQPGLSVERIQNISIPVPSLEEQQMISDFIASSTANLDNAISFSKNEISLLREYRTRLIADVVTGKLDSREAASLPDEVEEPEVLEDETEEVEENNDDELEEIKEEDGL